MPKWMKHRMSAHMLGGIPAGIGLRSDAGHPSGDGTAPAGGTTNTDGADNGDAGQGDQDKGKGPQFQGDFDKERAERALAASREGEKTAKAALKAEQERVAAILKAAGLTPDGKTDPEQLAAAQAAELESARTAARAASVELAVYKTAGDNGGDAAKLLDSNAFTSSIKDLDPAKADFADKVGKAIKATVEKHPHLAAGDASGGQGPNRQGVDHTGGGTGSKERPRSIREAINRSRGQ